LLTIGDNSGRGAVDAGTLREILSGYRALNRLRSIVEVVITALPFAALWVAAWLTFRFGYLWASLIIAVPAAGFLLRSSTTAVTAPSFPTAVRTIGSVGSSA
jgi:acyl-lipid omega-6 desaturase (Delta-12 desaturase)